MTDPAENSAVTAEQAAIATEMMANVPSGRDQPPAVVAPGTDLVAGFTSMASFELLQRIAKMFASSSIVPQQFRGPSNFGNCLIAVEMAQRIGASPLMVMQNIDVIHGRPSWRAQFAIACFNQCGRYETISYEYVGTRGQDDWGCQAISAEKRSGRVVKGPLVTMKMAKEEGWYGKSGSKWQTIPELMMTYRAGAWLVRTTAPEIMMGLPTADEVQDTFEATQDETGTYGVEPRNRAEQAIAALGGAPAANGKEPPKSIDMAPHLERIKKSPNAKALAIAWAEIKALYGGAKIELPKELDAAHHERKEGLEGNL